MHILYIHQYFNTPQHNGGTRSYDLASSFVANGHKVTLITTTRSRFNFPNKKRWNIVNIDGIEIHVLRNDYHNKMSAAKRILSFVQFAFFTSLHVLKIKADVVLATSTPLSIAIPALIKKRLQKTPYIFEVRDVWPEAPIALGFIKGKVAIKISYWFERFVYKRAKAIVALSDDMKTSIVTRCHCAGKVTVITNISELNRFDATVAPGQEKVPAREKIVLYAGSVAIVNNIEFVVKLAVELLSIDESIVFHIYSSGGGNRFEAVKAMAREKGVLDVNFFLKNAVSKNGLADIYRNCTVASSFVTNIPALWANSANKFFDTLAAGKPIVINHGGWQANEIANYNIGYVLDYDENNLRQTAEQFARYLNNKTLLAEQSKNALQLAKEKYSLSIAVAKYEHIFQKIKPDNTRNQAEKRSLLPVT